MQTIASRSRELFESGFFCAESVLLAVAEHEGIESDLIPRMATGFCGGMSRSSGLCGALTGGIMALGLLYGRDTPESSRDTVYSLVQQLVRDFKERFGSHNCTELLGCDLSTPQGRETFDAQGLLMTRCVSLTEEAAAMTARLIEEHEVGASTEE
jgi:C_GCAxxG_C_C family probable redox protein